MKQGESIQEKMDYPKHMYPHKNYHLIPRGKHLKNMMILRAMYNGGIEQMPDKGNVDLDMMKTYMRDSQFSSGISCNLLSVFKKDDSKFWVTNQDLTSTSWSLNSKISVITDNDFAIYDNPGYFGFKIMDVEKLSTTVNINDSKGKIIRTDVVFCKVVHCPNIVNFWHFNIFLYGIDSSNGEKNIYRLDERLNGNKIKKVAKSLMEDFYSILINGNNLKAYHLPPFYYRKGEKWNKYCKRHFKVKFKL